MKQLSPNPKELRQSQRYLICQGTGFAVLEMSGSVVINAMEGGNAYIMGAGSVRAQGEGEWIDRGPWTFLLGWHGELQVSGEDCQIQLSQRAINFIASGAGRARVRGHGQLLIDEETIPLTEEFLEIPLH